TSVHGVRNAGSLKTAAAGPLLRTGAGAGKLRTAGSILATLVAVARLGGPGGAAPARAAVFDDRRAAALMPIDDLETEVYLRLTTVDNPGVLSRVTAILGEEGISSRALTQKPEHDAENVPVIILTHAARNARVMAALKRIDALDVIRDATRVIRF